MKSLQNLIAREVAQTMICMPGLQIAPEGMRRGVADEIAKWNALIDKARIPRP